MDQAERTAREGLLVELAKDIRGFQEELRHLDKRSSPEAAERHKALSDQVKGMLATQVQMRAALEADRDHPR
jgi:hypothetical protein